ncbi:XRE family transcriptional regulator [Vandammella animalimorsus]|uniref:XRE family transcriptional regulator n=1 Tax=Vandammella animalimorsus TaxID=2029117 RepID=A0A2A2T7H3_9BURK|nr:type II toxin-antitoxin system MqsA family antitoxin [Vandammella animalimorsus]PAX17913.1 XRE family transcriptional regulator [Vandammella animalimorsus]
MCARKINLAEMADAVATKVQTPVAAPPAPLSATLSSPADAGSTPQQVKTRQARKALGLPQVNFARLINTPLALLNDWEQGRQVPPGAAVCLFELLIRHPELAKELEQPEQG